MDEPEGKKIAALIASDWGSPIHVHALVLMAVTGASIYLCYLVAAPFFPPLAWALALAVLFAPLQSWVESKVKRPNLAAMLSVLAVGLIVVVPATLVTQRIIGEAVDGAESVRANVVSGEWRHVFEGHPRIAPIGSWIEKRIDLPGMVQTTASWLTRPLRHWSEDPSSS